MGILDDYRKQLAEDEKTINDDFPEGSHLTTEQAEEYKKTLNELRNSTDSIEAQFRSRMNEMKKMTDKEMEENEMIKTEDDVRFAVKRAFCEDCGEELISNAPPMFNPFTFEKICKHTCPKCGKIYNFEYAYPRLVVMNKEGEELPVFLR